MGELFEGQAVAVEVEGPTVDVDRVEVVGQHRNTGTGLDRLLAYQFDAAARPIVG